jgi:hypothetical protein
MSTLQNDMSSGWKKAGPFWTFFQHGFMNKKISFYKKAR